MHKFGEEGIVKMMYIHYCGHCHRVHMLNGHKPKCPKCASELIELRISYREYVSMNHPQRESLLNDLKSEEKCKELSTVYHMHKYCKWYRDANGQAPEA